MVGGKSGTQMNVSLPSPYESEKADTAKILRNLLFPAMLPKMSGFPTAENAKSALGAQDQNINAASKLKIAPGSPQIGQALSLAKTNPNILNYAMQLYGMMPQGSSNSISSSGSKAGNLDYFNGLVNAYTAYDAAKSGGLFGGGGGGGGSTLGDSTTGSGDLDFSDLA